MKRDVYEASRFVLDNPTQYLIDEINDSRHLTEIDFAPVDEFDGNTVSKLLVELNQLRESHNVLIQNYANLSAVVASLLFDLGQIGLIEVCLDDGN
jgi:hypothetical protein